MEKKVTIKDVAKAAGVCQATVSYVLNDRADQKISEETKKKIWQVINLLNYKPNTFAKNLRGCREIKMIAIFSSEKQKPLLQAAYADFLERLAAVFQRSNYGAILLDRVPRKVDTADAIIAYRPTKASFYAMGEFNYVPLISVDCDICDPLFFQITNDYTKLNEEAKEFFQQPFTYVCLPPSDDAVRLQIAHAFDSCALIDEFSGLSKIDAENLLVTEPVLHTLLSETGKYRIYYPESVTTQKLDQIAKCVEMAVSHKTFQEHIFKI